MKKFLYLLMALPMLIMTTACSDDDDTDRIPQISVTVDYEGGTLNDGTFYVEQGETLDITALVVTPAEGTGKATLGQTTYYMDGVPFYTTPIEPWGCTIPTENLSVGKHILSVKAQVFQIDKSIGWTIFEYPLVVEEPQATLPDDQGAGRAITASTFTQD
ncbi:MAG: hypothetical protein K2K92_09250 [Duncaniella sp.]|nr:hypothetical protein [Duncaniella sp.]